MPRKSNFITKDIIIASDHAGFSLKENIITELKKKKFKIKNLGTYNDVNSVDYPIFAKNLCKKINSKNIGILVCGSGIGMSIAANRHKGIRAALVNSVNASKLSRLHNNANVICIGSRLISKKIAIKSMMSFLVTKFEGDRHLRRVKLLG